MNDIMKHLDKAYMHLSNIPVSGEAVDHMALARQEMRAAFNLAKELPEQKEDSNG